MKTVSVINYKGGVGKTTLTANLGAELAWRGYRVLLIDLDAQCSLTFSFVKPDYWSDNLAAGRTIKSWYDAMQSNTAVDLHALAIRPTDVASRLKSAGRQSNLHLIPSHLGLINVDLELATELGGATLKQAKINYLKVHERLAEGLAASAFDTYDLVIIDCPPNFNVVTKTAIVASDYILIPAKPDYLSTLGIDYLKRSLDELVRDFNDFAAADGGGGSICPEIVGVVFTMVQVYGGGPIQAHRNYIRQTRNLGMTVFDAYVRENKTSYGVAAEEGVPLVLQDANPRDLRTEMERCVDEFIAKVGI